jgi:hypothetical protein
MCSAPSRLASTSFSHVLCVPSFWCHLLDKEHCSSRDTLCQWIWPQPRLPNWWQHHLVCVNSISSQASNVTTTPQWAHHKAFFYWVVIDDDATAQNLPICCDCHQPYDTFGHHHRYPMGHMVSAPLPLWSKVMLRVFFLDAGWGIAIQTTSTSQCFLLILSQSWVICLLIALVNLDLNIASCFHPWRTANCSDAILG